MGRMKRILCFAMVIVVTIGFSVSSAIVSFAYETSHSGPFEASRLRYYFIDQWGTKRERLTSIRGTSFDYSISSSMVEADSTIDFDFECGQFSQNLDGDVKDYSVLVGRYDAKLQITVLNDTQYEENNITSFHPDGVFSYELCLWDNLSREVTIPIYNNSVDGRYVFGDYDRYIVEYDISADLNAKVPADFNWNSFASFLRIKYWTSWIMPLDMDINISGTISGSYTLTLDVLVEESINSNLEDVNSNLENIQDAINGDPSDYEGVGSDVESNSSDLLSDSSEFFNSLEEFDKTWQDSVQGIYDSIPNAKDPIGALNGGLVVDAADGTIISNLWSLIEEHIEISIFFTAGLLIVCVYFFLRR